MDKLYIVNSKDLIVNITFAWEGAIAIADDCDTGALVSHRFPTYTFISTEAIPCFFRYVIIKKDFVYKLFLISPGGAGRNRVMNKKDFLRITAYTPLIEEQQKIAECLSSVDGLIAAQARMVDALKAHKKGLMQQLFPAEGKTVPALRFPEFRHAPAWKNRVLGDFITERNSFAGSTYPLYSLTIEDGVTPKTERYERSFLVTKDEDAYKIVCKNDFAFNPMNLRFGAIAMHSGDCPVALSKYYNIFYCDDSVDNQFCEHYFRSDKMVSFYDRRSTGTLIEKRRVHFSDFVKFHILFPPLSEQQKIAECLSSVDGLIAAQARKLDALKLHKKGLMQQLFPAAGRELTS